MRAVNVALVSAISVSAMALAPAAHAATTGPPATSQTQYPYTFTNPNGSTTVIPSQPKRVVVLAVMDGVASLGAQVVGANQIGPPGEGGANSNGEPIWLNGGETNGVVNLGTSTPPYEEIAALHPDLIIGGSASQVPQLEAIAPTIQDGGENPNPNSSTPYLQNIFGWQDPLELLAPVFNETAHVNQMIARMRDRANALKPFIQGTSVATIIPLAANFLIVDSDTDVGDLFDTTGADIETTVPGTTSLSGGVLSEGSNEILPELTASKLLVETNWNTIGTPANFEALPTYNQIPAVQKGQVYYTQWEFAGPVGEADYFTQLGKEMFGATGLEATLTGTGTYKSTRTGVAELDVGGTNNTKVCWDIDTSTSTTGIGNPNSVVIENAKGTVRLFSLGKGYATTGCASVGAAASKQLLSSPRYVLSLDRTTTKTITRTVRKHRKKVKVTTTTVLLQGTVAGQTPAFFGNGKDTPYAQ